jgi:hypothetical protein
MSAVLIEIVGATLSFNIFWRRFTVVVFPLVHVTPIIKKPFQGLLYKEFAMSHCVLL